MGDGCREKIILPVKNHQEGKYRPCNRKKNKQRKPAKIWTLRGDLLHHPFIPNKTLNSYDEIPLGEWALAKDKETGNPVYYQKVSTGNGWKSQFVSPNRRRRRLVSE